jgi:hypothetical protein
MGKANRTLSFWFSLAISFVPQFVVAHWLAVHHPAHSSSVAKGSGFLSMLAGYAVGCSVFVLLQKLSPGKAPKPHNSWLNPATRDEVDAMARRLNS